VGNCDGCNVDHGDGAGEGGNVIKVGVSVGVGDGEVDGVKVGVMLGPCVGVSVGVSVIVVGNREGSTVGG
jgi:hypothetical protein